MLTKTQLTIAADILDWAYEDFVNHEQNDYTITATPAKRMGKASV